MKHLTSTFTILVMLSLLFSGCSKDKEGALRITFKGSYGQDPLVMLNVYDYADGQRIQFSRLEFFASDIRLIDGSGNDYPLSDVELIDLSANSTTAAETGVVLTFNDIPAGEYTDLEFGFGVAADINATTPVDYPSSSPLSSTGRYWTPWTSYIFSKTEGNLDTIADGTDNLSMGFAYHTGSDALYRVLQLDQPISIQEDATRNIVLNLDYQKLLGMPDEPLDIKAKPQNHSPLDIEHIQAIVDNLVSALTYTLN